MVWRAAAFIVGLAAASGASAEPYDHQALLRTLGFTAGQAAACGLDTPERAATVAQGLAALMGYKDDKTKDLLARSAAESKEQGCKWVSRDLDVHPEFRAQWLRQKRRLGID